VLCLWCEYAHHDPGPSEEFDHDSSTGEGDHDDHSFGDGFNRQGARDFD
jgi:hypothetical protein